MTNTAPEVAHVSAWDRAAVAAFDAGRDDILVIERQTLPEVAAATRRWRHCTSIAPL
jgi:hypothetical protein